LLFYQREVDGLGYIFDYQTPLKATQNDSYGKIDLLGYNTDDDCYSVIELKYRPSGSEETLLRCVLEAYTYYKLLDLKQIKSDVDHAGIKALKKELPKYKHTDKSELVILFDEKSCTDDDGGVETNLLLRIDPVVVDKPNYPSKTVVSQQYKECQELINPSKRKNLRALCEAILKQESKLKQIRFVVLRTEDIDKAVPLKNVQKWSSELDRSYRAETLLTITGKG
jgi:Holliday junction resolvase-like predicted endonuclease